MTSEQMHPAQVFYSYAYRDRVLRDRLEEHLSNLKYRGLIQTWYDRNISAGDEWAQQIDIHLNTADIILLLISSSFMASDYCYSIEMKRALERHKANEARVVPILLRPVVYTDAPFAKLRVLPTNRKPVVTWSNRDSAFVDVALGIEGVISLLPIYRLQPSKSIVSPENGDSNFVPRSSSHRDRLDRPQGDRGSRGDRGGSISRWQGSSREERQPREQPSRQQLEERQRAREQKYYSQALEVYEQALLRDPTDVAALNGKGNALVGLEHYNEALEAFNQVISHDPTPSVYISIGKAHLKFNRYEMSLEAYEQALQLDPTYADAYTEMGEVLELLGRTQEAQQVREKAKQLDFEE